MTLSKFLVLESKNFDLSDYSLEETKEVHRKLTRQWFNKNQSFEQSVKENFELVTKLNYAEHREEILDGYSDHYTEKLYVYLSPIQNVKSELNKIVYKDEDLEKIKKGVENKSILGFIGHLGGMEFIPTFFADKGIPVTVMLRFKSDTARQMAKDQIDRYTGLDFNLIDVGGELYRNFRKFLSQKRLLITVFDGFDNWQLNRSSEKANFVGHDVYLDSTPKRLHSLTGKGVVHYISIIRKGTEYHLNVVDIDVKEKHGLSTEIFKHWNESVQNNLHQWYIWDEVDELIEQENEHLQGS